MILNSATFWVQMAFPSALVSYVDNGKTRMLNYAGTVSDPLHVDEIFTLYFSATVTGTYRVAFKALTMPGEEIVPSFVPQE